MSYLISAQFSFPIYETQGSELKEKERKEAYAPPIWKRPANLPILVQLRAENLIALLLLGAVGEVEVIAPHNMSTLVLPPILVFLYNW
jgi:hypothetical protein